MKMEIFSRVALDEFITRGLKTSCLQVVSLGLDDQGEEPIRNLNGEKLSTSDMSGLRQNTYLDKLSTYPCHNAFEEYDKFLLSS